MRETDLDVVSHLVMLANPHAVKEKYRKLILDMFKANPDLFFVLSLTERLWAMLKLTCVATEPISMTSHLLKIVSEET